jgi:hypothetical protein
MTKPHSMDNDCGREAVAVVRVGCGFTHSVLSTPPGPPSPVTMTIPALC